MYRETYAAPFVSGRIQFPHVFSRRESKTIAMTKTNKRCYLRQGNNEKLGIVSPTVASGSSFFIFKAVQSRVIPMEKWKIITIMTKESLETERSINLALIRSRELAA